MSLYVRVHNSFWSHRKTLRLRAKIGDAAFWIPPRIWSYAADNQPNGDFSDYSAEEIAMLIGYSSNACSMLEALQSTGFLDEMRIHDWKDHNGYHSTFSERAKKAADARWKGNRKDQTRKDKIRKETSIAPSMLEASNVASLKKKSSEISKWPDLAALDGFEAEWANFLEHRKLKKAPMTPRARELFLDSLSKRPADAVVGIQTAIMRNWTGFKWDWFDADKTPKTNGIAPWQSAAERKQAEIDEANREYRARKLREQRQ